MSDTTPTLPTPVPSSTADYYAPMPVFYARPRRPRWKVSLLLLLCTVFTTLVVGSHLQASFNAGHTAMTLDFGDSAYPPFPLDSIWRHPSQLWLGLPFSASLMLILLAHELGHYLFCVYYGVDATLPYFIPFPSLVGTMGAFIRIRSPFRSRAALFDIGIAGPIAGFVVACAVLLIGLAQSHPAPAGALSFADGEQVVINVPLIFRLGQGLLTNLGFAKGLAGLPFDHISLHPVAIAAWFGMLATSLNLLPGGQLDGGHIIYSLAPQAHRIISRLTILCLIPMAVYGWSGWLLWAVLLELSSLRHPHVPKDPKIHGGRIWLAAFALLMLALALTPTPIAGASLKELLHPVREWVLGLLHHR